MAEKTPIKIPDISLGFPDKEKIDNDQKIKNKVNNIISTINFDSINEKVKSKLSVVRNKLETNAALKTESLLNSEDSQYLNSLPEKEKEKALRYLDIFRDNPDIVSDYLNVLKKNGSEKKAKELGETNILLNPKKALKTILENPEIYNEKTAERLEKANENLFGYDLMYREDEWGKKFQKEYYSKWYNKTGLGITEAVIDSGREATRWASMLVDAVGPENSVNALNYIESNWPKADDITYPNKTQPFNKDSAYTELAEGLTQFGIDTVLGGKILKLFAPVVKKIAPGTTKKLVEWYSKQGKAKVDKTGKKLTDQFGNIHFASSIAQKSGAWGLPVAIKYGIGRNVTSDEQASSFSEGFGFIPPIDRTKWDKMTSKERAVEGLKRKLIHGAEGTVLIAGLTKGFTKLGSVLMGTGKVVGSVLAKPADKYFLNPIAQIAASRKTGIPQLAMGIRKGGGFFKDKVLRIPPMEKWGFFSTTSGPLKERILGYIDSSILPGLRVRGNLTKEAKQIMLEGEQMINKYKKRVGLSIRQIDRSVHTLLGKGFSDKIFTTSSVQAGKQYWDDGLRYLKGEIPLSALPQVLRNGFFDIQKDIAKLSKEIAPYVKNQDIKKEIIDGMGKYLTTSYEIFQGSFKVDPIKKEAAVKYFETLIKNTKDKNGNFINADLTKEGIRRLAAQKVDDILLFGTEGSSPVGRINSIAKISSPDGIIKEKQVIPKVIQDLLGKVNNPINIITDTVTKQAELLSHLYTHKNILKEGLKSGWIVKNKEDFALKGVQKDVVKTLEPIIKIARTSNIDIGKIYSTAEGGNYYTTKEIAGAIASDALATDFLLQWAPVKYMLAAKTTAQLSKTVLSLMTQTRNFETAMFFSLMQGHIGGRASVLEAMKFTFGEVIGSTGKINPIALRKKFTEWSEVGVIDSSIVTGEVEAIIGDIVKGKYVNTDQLFKRLMKSPIFSKATELYQASDNVWKAYGYEFTKSQMLGAIPIRGVSVNNAKKLGFRVEPGRTVDYNWKDLVSSQFDEVFKMRWNPMKIDGSEKTYGDALKEISAKYIRDVYPNYNLVPSLVKNWRRLPMGNFVAFRSENIRNVFNTMAYSLREMSSMNPYLRQMGARRMVGLNATLYGIQESLSFATNILTGIDEKWLKKYQRWFSPYYNKNSTIFPMSKMDEKTKKFWTMNWSREQPYEGLQDAMENVFQDLFNPNDSDEAIAKRFFKGFIYDWEEDTPGAIYQVFEPFLTPSLFIEAVQDVLPSSFAGIGRSGVTKEGKIIYDIRNDSWGEIFAKISVHLATDINPTTFANAGKVLKATEGEISKSARTYNTTNELMKLFLGLGLEEQDPLASITYQISNFSERFQNVVGDFNRDASDPNKLLKNPFLLENEFSNYQMNLYREYSRAYEFINFLKNDLKLSNREIYKEVQGRYGFGNIQIGSLLRGKFYPANIPPLKVTSKYPKLIKKLNKIEKYKDLKLKDIYNVKDLQKIRKKWNKVPLNLSDEQLREYFITGKVSEKKPVEKIEPQSSIQVPKNNINKTTASLVTPNVPSDTAPVSAETIKTASVNNNVNPQTNLTRIEDALLSQTEKAIKLGQRKTTV